MKKDEIQRICKVKESDVIELFGKTFAIAVVDEAEGVFGEVIIGCIPKNLQHEHKEIHRRLKKHRTNLIQELHASGIEYFPRPVNALVRLIAILQNEVTLL